MLLNNSLRVLYQQKNHSLFIIICIFIVENLGTFMKKELLLLGLIAFLISCSASKTNSNPNNSYDSQAVGLRQKTVNPNTPYIYKNGYNHISIVPILSLNGNDSTYINELRFNAVFSAMYTKKLMYDKYGKWDKEIWPEKERHPILVWENIQLFDSEKELFSIAANGTESWEEMYASVIVFDSQDNDCFKENSKHKESLLTFFDLGIRSVNSDKEFYNIYWDIVNNHKK